MTEPASTYTPPVIGQCYPRCPVCMREAREKLLELLAKKVQPLP